MKKILRERFGSTDPNELPINDNNKIENEVAEIIDKMGKPPLKVLWILLLIVFVGLPISAAILLGFIFEHIAVAVLLVGVTLLFGILMLLSKIIDVFTLFGNKNVTISETEPGND